MKTQDALCMEMNDVGSSFRAAVEMFDHPDGNTLALLSRSVGPGIESSAWRHAGGHVFEHSDGRRIAIFLPLSVKEPSACASRDESDPPPGYEIHHYTPHRHGVSHAHWRLRVKGYALMATFESAADALHSAWRIHDEHGAAPARREEDITQPFEHQIFVHEKRLEAVRNLIETRGHVSNAEHKQWIIDQMLRALMPARDYDEWRREYNALEDEFPWSEGVEP